MNSATQPKPGMFAKAALLPLTLSVIWVSGCAGPSGGLIPLGPPFDQPVSFALFGGLLLRVVLWIGKSKRDLVGRLGNPWRGTSVAEDILRKRYARGEINRSQFVQMLDDLRKGPALF